MLSEACNILGFEDTTNDWKGNNRKARHSFFKVNLCIIESHEGLFSRGTEIGLPRMDGGAVCSSTGPYGSAVNNAKQADENEVAEFTTRWPLGAQHEEHCVPKKNPGSSLIWKPASAKSVSRMPGGGSRWDPNRRQVHPHAESGGGGDVEVRYTLVRGQVLCPSTPVRQSTFTA